MSNHLPLLDDYTLWREFKSGSTSAFNIIFKQYQKVLFNYGRKFTSDFDLIEDCIQDLFLEILEKKEILSDTNSIKFYLYKGLRRKLARCELNNNRLGVKTAISEGTHMGSTSCYETILIEHQLQFEKFSTLSKAVSSLSKRKKQALQLRYFDNYSYDKIAESMSIDINAVYKLVSMALRDIAQNYALFIAI